MTVDDSASGAAAGGRTLWLAVAELVLTTNDDQPEESDLASRRPRRAGRRDPGRLAEAPGSLAGHRRSRSGDALREACAVELLVREAASSTGATCARTARSPSCAGPPGAAAEPGHRGGRGVEQSLSAARSRSSPADAVGTAWHELCRRRSAHPNRRPETARSEEVVVTNDKKQPGLPVVEVDQAFPLMTTDGVSRPATSTGTSGDQGPAVTAAIRDVLGWRPRGRTPRPSPPRSRRPSS